jgi:hypothetical protein
VGQIEEVMLGRAELCFSLTVQQLVDEVNTYARENDGHEEGRHESVVNYEVLDRLVGLPREGDKIAFKVLNINSSFEQVVSSYRVGLVKAFEVDTNTIKLNLSQQLLEEEEEI